MLELRKATEDKVSIGILGMCCLASPILLAMLLKVGYLYPEAIYNLLGEHYQRVWNFALLVFFQSNNLAFAYLVIMRPLKVRLGILLFIFMIGLQFAILF